MAIKVKHIFVEEKLEGLNVQEIDMLQELINKFLENNPADIIDVEYDVIKDGKSLHHNVLIFYEQK